MQAQPISEESKFSSVDSDATVKSDVLCQLIDGNTLDYAIILFCDRVFDDPTLTPFFRSKNLDGLSALSTELIKMALFEHPRDFDAPARIALRYYRFF